MVLFKLPRDLGQTPHGGAGAGQRRPLRAVRQVRRQVRVDQATTIRTRSSCRALVLIEQRKQADATRIIIDFTDAGIQVLNGRYGPYITDTARNAKIPRDRDPKTLTVDECRELLAQAPQRRGGRGRFGKKAAAAPAATVAEQSQRAVKRSPKVQRLHRKGRIRFAQGRSRRHRPRSRPPPARKRKPHTSARLHARSAESSTRPFRSTDIHIMPATSPTSMKHLVLVELLNALPRKPGESSSTSRPMRTR